MQLFVDFGQTWLRTGAESYDVAGRGVKDRKVPSVTKGCTRSLVAAVEAVAVSSVFESRPSRFI